jgi:ATPase subunit of ABC transporter with duplicated ATPase domains
MPGTIIAANVTKSYGPRPVLRDVCMVIVPGARIGLVGPNGVGKSTLLRILAGVETPDAGSVRRAPPGLHAGYLTQEIDALPAESVYAYLARRTGVAAAESAVDELASRLHDAATVQAHADALETFVALGGADLGPRAESMLPSVGLEPSRIAEPMAALSPGQAARAALAAILLSRFDVLLLDEPTNNLDFAGLDRLEAFLAEAPVGVVVISHDRAFLDRAVNRIVEIEEHTHIAREFAGGWTSFVGRRELARAQQYAAHERSAAERRRLEERLRRQRSWSERGVAREKRVPRDNDKAQRDFRINRTEKQASKVRATERAIERLEVVEKPWEGWRLDMSLRTVSRAGDVVVRLENAIVRRGSFELGPLDVEVAWRDRIAVIGPNGAGKSTLVGALTGDIPLAHGRRYLGPGTVFGAMRQDRALLAGGATLLDAFRDATGLLPEDARGLLAKFSLGPDHVVRDAGALSPGERTRAELAALMARGTNCLVLDEPTNHLDLPAIEQLESALGHYDGTLVLVTHDRWLLDRIELTRTLELESGNDLG